MSNPAPGQTVSAAIVAWTGGSMPLPLEEVSASERKLVEALFEAQCAAFRAFWGREPDAGIRDTYMVAARYDAHATVRAGNEIQGILG